MGFSNEDFVKAGILKMYYHGIKSFWNLNSNVIYVVRHEMWSVLTMNDCGLSCSPSVCNLILLAYLETVQRVRANLVFPNLARLRCTVLWCIGEGCMSIVWDIRHPTPTIAKSVYSFSPSKNIYDNLCPLLEWLSIVHVVGEVPTNLQLFCKGFAG